MRSDPSSQYQIRKEPAGYYLQELIFPETPDHDHPFFHLEGLARMDFDLNIFYNRFKVRSVSAVSLCLAIRCLPEPRFLFLPMSSQFHTAWSLLILQLFTLRASSVQLWSSPNALTPIVPAGCRVALSQNITCSPDLVSPQFAAGGRALDQTTLGQYCTTACYQSLQVPA